MTQSFIRRKIPFVTTPSAPCPYLPDKLERKLVTALSGIVSPELFHALSLAGFRRSHHLAYVPACNSCKACISVRIVVENFTPRRTLSRVWKQNADLSGSLEPPLATEEQFSLFHRYVTRRHADGDMASMAESDYVYMVEDTPVDTSVVEFRDANRNLIAACLVDHLPDGLSAVYSFFDPDCGREGLGNFMVLWLIELARERNMPYVYLGYWIADCGKMAYKARFKPLEGMRDGQWLPFDDLGD